MGHSFTALALGPACAATVKVALWIVGLGYAIKFRRLLFTLAATVAAATSTVRGIADSGGHVTPVIAHGVVYWSTPGVALIIAAFVAGRYPPVGVGRGWRL